MREEQGRKRGIVVRRWRGRVDTSRKRSKECMMKIPDVDEV